MKCIPEETVGKMIDDLLIFFLFTFGVVDIVLSLILYSDGELFLSILCIALALSAMIAAICLRIWSEGYIETIGYWRSI